VVGLFTSVVVSTWPLAPWDEPSAGGSLVGLFLGGISWGFFSSRERWAPLLGFDSRGLTNSSKSVT
jgi:hypothetical protein